MKVLKRNVKTNVVNTVSPGNHSRPGYNRKNIISRPRRVQTKDKETNYSYNILPQYNIAMYDGAAPWKL